MSNANCVNRHRGSVVWRCHLSSCLFINSLCLGCNTSLDRWWRPYSILEWNSRLAPVFSLGMCNAISMCFGVGKPPTTRQTSWARLITYSYCLGLTGQWGHHHPPQGSHPLSAMPHGWICCSSFYVMPQRMIPSSQECDLYGFTLTLSTPWVSRDFLNAFLKIVT